MKERKKETEREEEKKERREEGGKEGRKEGKGFESTFLKAGDYETRKGLGQKKQQESPGNAAVAHWDVREKGTWRQGHGVIPGDAAMPVAPLATSLRGSLSV